MHRISTLLFGLLFIFSCQNTSIDDQSEAAKAPFIWDNANVYFVLTDRFYNGDPSNDNSYGRQQDGAVNRSYFGGDIRGIIEKLEEGYFEELGITAIWTTPVFENIHGSTDEGTGLTYAYHGYWVKDFTTIDKNLGTMADYKELVEKAHARGIRVLMDVIINHTGPVTDIDTQWPDEWVRTEPSCTYNNFKTTVECTLVDNLPDIRTESNEDVELPEFLVEKWKNEGRYEQEIQELDNFFASTGHPRAPRFYIIKWLTDYVRELGIDGFRVDTVKHTEPSVWAELFAEAVKAFRDWKQNNPDAVLDDNEFYMVGEVYGYAIQHGQLFDMGDSLVNFYENGFQALINFSLKDNGKWEAEKIFSEYSQILHGELSAQSTLNYISSHDDGSPLDPKRINVFDAATKLLLAPGASQVYYGDETARKLIVEGAEGDANLRDPMNWQELETSAEKNGYVVSDVYKHYSKLGKFRRDHPAVGAGVHTPLNSSPYTFRRSLAKGDLKDDVVVVLGDTKQPVNVAGVFEEGTLITDYYSGLTSTVKEGTVQFQTTSDHLLLGVK